MSNYIVSDTDLTSVANAIRTKGGTSAPLSFPSEFVSAIGNIPTGGGGITMPPGLCVDCGTITPASNTKTLYIDINSSNVDFDDGDALIYFHIIMPNNKWATYEGDSTYDNKAAGYVSNKPASYYATNIAVSNLMEIFLSTNANYHSYKSGGSVARTSGLNQLTVTSYNGTGYGFIGGETYSWILVAGRTIATT